MQDHPFYAFQSHGLIRVAAATPAASVGDPHANAAAMLDLAREADEKGVDLIVFPELSLTSYAIDDLHLQSAMHRATLDALGEMVDEAADPVLERVAHCGMSGCRAAVTSSLMRVRKAVPRVGLKRSAS